MRLVLVTAALGGAFLMAGAAAAQGWPDRPGHDPGRLPVADGFDAPRHGWGEGGGRRHGEGGHGEPRHSRDGGEGHAPAYGLHEPPRPHCWVRETHRGPERVCNQ